ncbi:MULTISPECIES: hypothetical protein [Pseudoalteromonas]|nr:MULTISPECIES: hypothetical protein [Pseudoalteromonas]NUJ31651.1 hypothetical protein [Pseudoalteromonas sp. 2103]
MNISHSRFFLYLIVMVAVFFNNISLAVTLNDIDQIEIEIKQLNSQSDHGLSQIPSLVSQLNSAELSQNNDRESPTPNITELDNILNAILKNKLALADHINNYQLYTSLQQQLMSLIAGTDKTAIAHKSISFNLLLAGPNSEVESFFVNYLNSDEIGGLRLREALMYFTLHPNDAVKDRVSFFASERGHPVFRGPASWAFGKLSVIDDSAAIAQLTSALNQSITDNFGFDTKLLTLLGLAEVANSEYIITNFMGTELDEDLLILAVRYSAYKRATGAEKDLLISSTFNEAMIDYERDEALSYILKNNKADLLKTLGLLFDTDNGLALSPELAQLADIYGYQISGSADNPIISAK